MTESDPAAPVGEDEGKGNRFRRTLVSVLAVQVIALLLLGWMQHHFSH